jgi:hypothetical protein
MSNNKCNCPDPPGGTVECEANQLAICSIKGGKVEAKCVSPPSRLAGTALQNWVLENVTGIPRRASTILNHYDREILRSQTYRSPDGKLQVSFRVPLAIKDF